MVSPEQTLPIAILLLLPFTSLSSNSEVATRSLWEFPKAFDFYNQKCACSGTSQDQQNAFYDNPCPQCENEFSHFHCNSCCAGGASSLKIKWHGCNSEVSFTQEKMERCDIAEDSKIANLSTRIKFIDCDCYDQVISSGTGDFSECSLFNSVETFSDDIPSDDDDIPFSPENVFCIVSTSIINRRNDVVVNLTQPLPNPLGLHQYLNKKTTDASTNTFHTFFDTSCELLQGNDHIRPVYPGFGKAPDSCPENGFIDMYGKMPESFDPYIGIPSAEIFWFQFLDGTSASFSPSVSDFDDAINFDFTFSTCSCIQCPTEVPTLQPSTPPSYLPTPRITPGPASMPVNPVVLCENPDFARDNEICNCPIPELIECDDFAFKNCVNKTNQTLECSPVSYFFGNDDFNRNLEELELVVRHVEEFGLSSDHIDSKYHDPQWIQEQVAYHSEQIQVLQTSNSFAHP